MEYEAKDFRIGQRVQLHPATDLFMRGARYGTVTMVHNNAKKPSVHVRIDALGQFPRSIHPRNLLPVD